MSIDKYLLKQDNRARDYAVPFKGHFWGDNQDDNTEFNFGNSYTGDANIFASSSSLYTTITNNNGSNTYTIPTNTRFQGTDGNVWYAPYDTTIPPATSYGYNYVNALYPGYQNQNYVGNLAIINDPTGGQVSVHADAPSGGINTVTASSLSNGKTLPMRILIPHYGPLVECYVDFTMATTNTALTAMFAIGYFNQQSPSYTVNQTYSDDYIKQSWTAMNGKSTPLAVSNGAIQINSLNLLPGLYPSTSPYFCPEGFVLMLCLNQKPTIIYNDSATPFISTFNIRMSTAGIK